MTNDKHPFLDALLDGMEGGISVSANAILKHLKAQQEKDLSEGKADTASRAEQIAKLEALCADIETERAKREAQKETQSEATPQAQPEEPKPWWKDELNKDSHTQA